MVLDGASPGERGRHGSADPVHAVHGGPTAEAGRLRGRHRGRREQATAAVPAAGQLADLGLRAALQRLQLRHDVGHPTHRALQLLDLPRQRPDLGLTSPAGRQHLAGGDRVEVLPGDPPPRLRRGELLVVGALVRPRADHDQGGEIAQTGGTVRHAVDLEEELDLVDTGVAPSDGQRCHAALVRPGRVAPTTDPCRADRPTVDAVRQVDVVAAPAAQQLPRHVETEVRLPRDRDELRETACEKLEVAGGKADQAMHQLGAAHQPRAVRLHPDTAHERRRLRPLALQLEVGRVSHRQAAEGPGRVAVDGVALEERVRRLVRVRPVAGIHRPVEGPEGPLVEQRRQACHRVVEVGGPRAEGGRPGLLGRPRDGFAQQPLVDQLGLVRRVGEQLQAGRHEGIGGGTLHVVELARTVVPLDEVVEVVGVHLARLAQEGIEAHRTEWQVVVVEHDEATVDLGKVGVDPERSIQILCWWSAAVNSFSRPRTTLSSSTATTFARDGIAAIRSSTDRRATRRTP